MAFIPHTSEDIRAMLETIGVVHVDQLFDEIPKSLKYTKPLKMAPALTEMEMLQLSEKKAGEDAGYLSFLGAGAYQHHIPAAVWALVTRGEFYTAYTPYQAEASQGSLQQIYEYQTMMANLTGMEVSNASLYDGASSLAEAVLMAVRTKKIPRVLCPETLHPYYRETVKNIVKWQGIELVTWPFDAKTGTLDIKVFAELEKTEFSALILPFPNFFGALESVDILTDWAHQRNALVIAVVNPIALGLLKPPGEWGQAGADIVCGDGQPLGVPVSSGGPYFGFLTTRLEHIRQMPGRLVGKTEDAEGRVGFTLTLQAREQHIRRAKAKSNICTNQGLLVAAATIYMSLLGAEGLKQVALKSHQNAVYLKEKLLKIPGVTIRFHSEFFHEFVVDFAQPVLEKLQAEKILGGVALATWYPKLEKSVLINTTEVKSIDEMDQFVAAVSRVLGGASC